MLDLEKLNNMPIHERMRANYKWRNRKRTDRWKIVNRILQSYIGKFFNIAYSNFCFNIKSYQEKSDFLNEFNSRWRNINNYYVDENGLIQKTIETKYKLKTYIYSDDYKTAIVHKETGHLKDLFYEKWSKKIVKHSGFFTNNTPYYRKDKDKFLGYQYKGKYYLADNKDFVEKIISGSRVEVTSSKDYRYKRHWADKNKIKKSLDKKQKALKQQEYLEKQKKLMQEKKCKEKKENDLKILAAGFNLKTSFRNRKNE